MEPADATMNVITHEAMGCLKAKCRLPAVREKEQIGHGVVRGGVGDIACNQHRYLERPQKS